MAQRKYSKQEQQKAARKAMRKATKQWKQQCWEVQQSQIHGYMLGKKVH